MAVEPEDYQLDTIVVTYQRFTVDQDGTGAAAGTVTFELISPTKVKTDGIDVTLKPVTGYLGEDGAMRRGSRVGEEGIELVCMASDFEGVDELVYKATFNLTDGLGSGRIVQKPVTFAVTNNDIVLNELT